MRDSWVKKWQSAKVTQQQSTISPNSYKTTLQQSYISTNLYKNVHYANKKQKTFVKPLDK